MLTQCSWPDYNFCPLPMRRDRRSRAIPRLQCSLYLWTIKCAYTACRSGVSRCIFGIGKHCIIYISLISLLSRYDSRLACHCLHNCHDIRCVCVVLVFGHLRKSRDQLNQFALLVYRTVCSLPTNGVQLGPPFAITPLIYHPHPTLSLHSVKIC